MISILAVTILSLIGWYCFVCIAPQGLRSVSRHSFWKLRDSFADEILNGNVDKSEAALVLLNRIEKVIQYIPDLTLWKLLFFPKPSDQHLEEFKSSDKLRIRLLNKHDKKVIEKHEKDFMQLFYFHIALTSPFGWIILVVALFCAVFVLVTKPIMTFTIGIKRAIGNALSKVVPPKVSRQFDFSLEMIAQQNQSNPVELCVG
ncbi:MAG: hypothetical protein JKX85_11570 [Phycisphaeraceae bacterium]|nr:hypothetical protein [Phycisphaeraceae bacterium]